MTIWSIVNSPAVIAALASLAAWGLSKLYLANPAWAVWEGTLITAIKYAEKAIPDDADNRGVRRLDTALAKFIAAYEKIKGRTPSKRIIATIKQAIPLVHARLEAMGKV